MIESDEDPVSGNNELVSVALGQEEALDKYISGEKWNLPLRQNIEQLEGNYSEKISADFKSHIDFSLPIEHTPTNQYRAPFNPNLNYCEIDNYIGDDIEFDEESDKTEDEELHVKQPEEDVETKVMSGSLNFKEHETETNLEIDSIQEHYMLGFIDSVLGAEGAHPQESLSRFEVKAAEIVNKYVDKSLDDEDSGEVIVEETVVNSVDKSLLFSINVLTRSKISNHVRVVGQYGNEKQHILIDLEEFKTFGRKRSKEENEHEQREVIKLISSWNNQAWEPGGVLQNNYKELLVVSQKMQRSHDLLPTCFAFQNQNLASKHLSGCVVIFVMTNEKQGTNQSHGVEGSKMEIRDSKSWHRRVNTNLRSLVRLDDVLRLLVGVDAHNRRRGAEICVLCFCGIPIWLTGLWSRKLCKNWWYKFKVSTRNRVLFDKRMSQLEIQVLNEHKDTETACVLLEMGLNGDIHKFSYPGTNYGDGGMTWLKLPSNYDTAFEKIRKGTLKLHILKSHPFRWMVSHDRNVSSSCVLRQEESYVMVVFTIAASLILSTNPYVMVAEKNGTELSISCCYGSHSGLDFTVDVAANIRNERLIISAKETKTQIFDALPHLLLQFFKETITYFADSRSKPTSGTEITLCKVELSSVCKLLFGALVFHLLAEQRRDYYFFGFMAQWKWHPQNSFIKLSLTSTQSFILEDIY